MGTSARPVRDEWLLTTLEAMITPEQMVQLKAERSESYWEVATRRGFATDEHILTALAKRFRMKIADVGPVSQQARELVPESLARKYRVLPLSISATLLDIATSDPHDLDCERGLAFALGRTVRMSLASPTKIQQRLDEVYRPDNVIDNILQGFAGTYELESISEMVEESDLELGANKAQERPIIQLVDRIIAEAISVRASDIHLEPEESGVAVRYRIDGVLRQVMVLPRAAGTPVVSRVKIMAQLDIADRMRPQDGRARVSVGGGSRVDLRVSTLPASHGEKIVIRILDQRATVLSLDALGMHPAELERVNALLQAREGIVLVTGPTGSGKTTTLYSMLRTIQSRGVNIVTVEDPVEYRLQGVVQVQVNEKAGLTFPAALRSILRQDPDVILVGEVRDHETAIIAVQASLTGHLVLTTLHTNDAATSIARLMDIGIESYKLAAAVRGIVAQRLLRRLCPHCREQAPNEAPEKLKKWFPAGSMLYRPVGCAECAQTGFRGRLAVTEVLIMSPELERRIAAGDTSERVAEAARDSGMRGLWESGVQHALSGVTSLDEVVRVVEAPGDQTQRAVARARHTPPFPAQTATPAADVAGSGVASPRAFAPLANDLLPPVKARVDPLPATAPAAFTGESFQLVDERAHGADGASKRVLLVEDEDVLRRVLKDLLEREGFTVFEAADGVMALDQVDRVAPDIVVLDLNLPRLDGYGVLSHLRARPGTADLPVIVLTAKGDEDSEVRVFEYGASDYLTKPFRPRALSARLHSLLGRVKR
ncbi:MAG TPA: ATPase, T2SS/T4P/T4SS family [Gemmatimonadaceae bacterium]|nr:ATPase, T2SS/T4P/T4SS family [Gemmatimonadaceae bacterium]